MWYAVRACIPPATEGYLTDGLFTEVEGEDTDEARKEAAVRAIERYECEVDDLDAGYCDTVYVLPVEIERVVVYKRIPGVELAAMQCCGGSGTPDGHSGWCPVMRAAEKREREEAEEPAPVEGERLEHGWRTVKGYICDGCAVNPPHEHRCHGSDGGPACTCELCYPPGPINPLSPPGDGPVA